MSELGVSLDCFSPAREIVAQARAAEAGGAKTLWIATHLFLRDPVALAGAALAATERLEVALMALSPFSIHPVYAAMTAATLDELYPGRVVLSLGVGAPGDLDAAGIAAERPLARIAESVEICRRLYAGETLDHNGEIYRLGGRGLINAPRDIPIVLAASGPRMLALAGRIADGVLLSTTVSVPFVRQCIARLGDGDAARYGQVYTRIGEAPAELKRALGFVLRGAHHGPNLEAAGVELDQEALRAAWAAEDWSGVERMIGPEVLAAHAACGTEETVRARVREYRDAGLDQVIIAGVTDAEEIARVLRAVG
ncbi:MAG: LLM class flavin-dependent oxidoreductase [Defluviicoccus sp.]|nr:LLM class flavin-dependent oxidoreductase [Defluviicoccus sp.]